MTLVAEYPFRGTPIHHRGLPGVVVQTQEADVVIALEADNDPLPERYGDPRWGRLVTRWVRLADVEVLGPNSFDPTEIDLGSIFDSGSGSDSDPDWQPLDPVDLGDEEDNDDPRPGFDPSRVVPDRNLSAEDDHWIASRRNPLHRDPIDDIEDLDAALGVNEGLAPGTKVQTAHLFSARASETIAEMEVLSTCVRARRTNSVGFIVSEVDQHPEAYWVYHGRTMPDFQGMAPPVKHLAVYLASELEVIPEPKSFWELLDDD